MSIEPFNKKSLFVSLDNVVSKDEYKEARTYSTDEHHYGWANFPKTGHESLGHDFTGEVKEKTIFVFREDIEEAVGTGADEYIVLDSTITSDDYTLIEVNATAHDITGLQPEGMSRPMRGFWHILGYHMHGENYDYYNVGITQDGVVLEAQEFYGVEVWWDVMVITMRYCEGNPFQKELN